MSPHHRERVLVAEDDFEIRRGIVELLEADGYDVVEYETGTGLQSYFDDGMLFDIPRPRVDAIVTDLRMPNMGGLAVMEYFRDMGWDVPTVVVTAYGDRDTKRRARELGAFAVIDKPVDPEALRRTLREALDQHAKAG